MADADNTPRLEFGTTLAAIWNDHQWQDPHSRQPWKRPDPEAGRIAVERVLNYALLRVPDLDTITPQASLWLVPSETGGLLHLHGAVHDTPWRAIVQAADVKIGRDFTLEWAAVIGFRVGTEPPHPQAADMESPDIAADAAAAWTAAYAAFTRVAAIGSLVQSVWGATVDTAHVPRDMDETELAAAVYRHAESRGLPPRHWVQQALGGSVSRADRALRKARAQRLLPPITDGRQHNNKRKGQGR